MVVDAKLFSSTPLQKKLSVTLMFECMTFKIPKMLFRPYVISL